MEKREIIFAQKTEIAIIITISLVSSSSSQQQQEKNFLSLSLRPKKVPIASERAESQEQDDGQIESKLLFDWRTANSVKVIAKTSRRPNLNYDGYLIRARCEIK